MTFSTTEVAMLLAFAVQWGYTMHRISAVEKIVGKLVSKMEVQK